MLYQINHGTVAYADKVVLKDISFEIRNTEKIAIVGRNGCGKTTLLKLIMGEVDLSKRDSDQDSFITKAGNPTVGWLQQMTFEDNEICLGAEIKKVFEPILVMKNRMKELLEQIEKSADEKLIEEYASLEQRFAYLGGYRYEKDYQMVLDRFGFTGQDEEKRLSEVSGGQRTKIAFIKLLLSKPDILLLDEPAAGMNPHETEDLMNIITRIRDEFDMTILLIEHDMKFVSGLCDEVTVLNFGTVLAQGDTKTALNDPEVIKAYIGG